MYPENVHNETGVDNIFSQKTWWILLILWCVLIFGFTALPSFTSQNTGDVIERITHLPNRELSNLNLIIRKTMHVTLYSVLAFLLFNWTDSKALLSYILTTIFAASDEVHQLFVPGRGPAIHDVILDSAAALFMIIILVQIKKHRIL